MVVGGVGKDYRRLSRLSDANRCHIEPISWETVRGIIVWDHGTCVQRTNIFHGVNASKNDRSISNINALEIQAEGSTVGESLHIELIYDIVVISCPPISQSNTHDAVVDV